MEVQINSKEELIDFINRSDVSINDALKVAKQCFGVVPIVFKNEAGETTFSKADIIEKINNDKQKRVWIM
ncbi:hypothetical protein AB3G34_02320 [Flavobacterium sp. WC2409]|uniref:Uncharacterized protein n=1 Tax=Flavobacterium sp. WC2409 TaxID=3234139 RepID=A0AB39W6R1_9FLAO